MFELLNRENRVKMTADNLRKLGHGDLAGELEDRESDSDGGFRAMTLTQAVKAVNEAGFTLRVDHDFYHTEPDRAGWFEAGDGLYEVVCDVDGLDGYVVQGMSGAVASGVMMTPDEVIESLAHREPRERREFVGIDR